MNNEFKERIKVDKEENNKKIYDVAAYPFGAEELLLKVELNELDKDYLEK